MSMNIEIKKTYDDRTKLDKTLTNLKTLTGDLKDPTDILNPVVTVKATDGGTFYNYIRKEANYAYIPVFGRYYFINDIEIVNGDCVRFHMHEDVLKSFSSAIKNQKAIIDRTGDSSKINKYLNDSNYIVNSDPYISTIPFKKSGSNFTFSGNNSWVLVLAGPGDVVYTPD